MKRLLLLLFATTTASMGLMAQNLQVYTTQGSKMYPATADLTVGLNANQQLSIADTTYQLADVDSLVVHTPRIPALTPQQISLIEGYKQNLGIDLSPFLGAVRVRTYINYPGGSDIQALAEPFDRSYDGCSVITLSDHATADRPVLRITHNPMGMTSFMGRLLHTITMGNTEFWGTGDDDETNEELAPNYKTARRLLNWNRNKPGVFNLEMDSLVVSNATEGVCDINFTHKAPDNYGELKSYVNFRYYFSPWEQLKQLLAEGNEEAQEIAHTDGTANPDYYLQNSAVDVDEWDGSKYFVVPQGKMNLNQKRITFQFSFDHENAAENTRVFVVYEPLR